MEMKIKIKKIYFKRNFIKRENKFVLETRKIELYRKQRSLSISEFSKATRIYISISLIRKFITNFVV